jgi:hypothetical protein
MRAWVVAAGLVGCAGEEVEESVYEPANLEAPRVTPSVAVSGRVDALGTLSVRPDGGGWALDLATATSAYTVEVVSPAGTDLSVFDGTQARLAVARVPGTDAYAVAILTPEGEVEYLLEPVRPGTLTDSVFGPGLVGRGNDLGPVRRDGVTLELRSAWLRTDGVDLELLPGEPVGVQLRDRPYRVVLLSAWDVADALDGCAPPEERLAYEVVRVDGAIDETPLERDPAVPLFSATCAE